MSSPIMDTYGKHCLDFAISHGFRGPGAEPKSIVEDFALIHSEISEALEAYRSGRPIDSNWIVYKARKDIKDPGRAKRARLTSFHLNEGDLQYSKLDPSLQDEIMPSSEGIGTELADVLIRIIETAAFYGINLDDMIKVKMAYNEQREWRNGKGKL